MEAVGIFRATVQKFGAWTLGVETRSIGPYPLSQDGTLTASPSFITNGRLKTEITHNVSIFLHVLNVFYRPYYDIEYEQDYRVTPTTPVVPAGITVHPAELRNRGSCESR